MSDINHNILKSILRYLPILLGNFFLIIYFLYTYATDVDVHAFFTLTVVIIWFVFNLSCIFIMLWISKNEDISIKECPHRIKSKKNNSLYIFSLLKYIAILYVNYAFISTAVDRYTNDIPTHYFFFLSFLFYNLFSFGFIRITRKSRDKEFYRFIMIVLPLIVVFISNLIVKYR